MRRLLSIVFVFAFILLVGDSCRKDPEFRSKVASGPEPVSAFSYGVDPQDPLKIIFTDNSSDGETYYWQFGDGTTSSEPSPTHVYAASARYAVSLTVRSAAGYTADTSMEVVAAAPATADFTTMMSGPYVQFQSTASGATAVSWDFGDQSPVSDTTAPAHLYSQPGDYTVELTVYGIAGDTVVKSKTVTVTMELIQGGGFEQADQSSWKVWSQQTGIPPVFGYTGDHPAGGTGGCLQFPAFQAPSGGSINELIYQPVHVVEGKQYQFSALVKVPAGGSQCYLQFYLSEDPDTWVENNGQPFTNLFVSMNAWHGWGATNNTAAADGAILQLSTYGPYVSTGGVYTATATGTLYLGIQAGSWQGYSNGDLLVDTVSFKQLP